MATTNGDTREFDVSEAFNGDTREFDVSEGFSGDTREFDVSEGFNGDTREFDVGEGFSVARAPTYLKINLNTLLNNLQICKSYLGPNTGKQCSYRILTRQ